MEIILFVLGVGNLVLLFLLYQQRTADNKQVRDLLEDQEVIFRISWITDLRESDKLSKSLASR